MNAEQRIIREAGFKVTLPRILVLRILRASHDNGEHLNAETIYKRIINGGDQVSLAAVYRILSQFEAAGLVIRRQFLSGHSQSVYELAEGRHHSHMVCKETGVIIEFSNDTLDRIEREIAATHGYDVVNSEVVLYVRKKSKT